MSRAAASACALLARFADRTRAGRGYALPLPDDVVAYLAAREIDSLYHLERPQAGATQDAYDIVWALQRDALREALVAWIAEGLRPVVFKGGELCERWLGPHALGVMGDIDVLMPRRQLEEAKAVLYGLGYRHGFVDGQTGSFEPRDVVDIARMEVEHYELAPFIKAVPLPASPVYEALARERPGGPIYMSAAGPVLRLELDVHHNVATDVEVEGFFERAIPSIHGLGETFCDADHLWLNLSRYYNEVALHGKQSLRSIAYTLPLIASRSCDWDHVGAMAKEMRLGPTLYYFLALADRLCPGHTPADLLERVRRSSPSRVRDWGWQIGKLFDLEEPFPSAMLSLTPELTA